MNEKKRQVVIEFRAVVEVEDGSDGDMFEYTAETLRELRDNLTAYAAVEKFRVFERRRAKP